VQRPAALWPATWQQIGAYLAQHGPHRPQQVEQALGLRRARDAMRRMHDAGLLVRVGPGVYQWAERQD
jgi:hypothetical protein